MTKLEQQIYDALLKYEDAREGDILTQSICKGHARVVARIAIQLAREAFEAGWNSGYNEGVKFEDASTFKQFIQDYE